MIAYCAFRGLTIYGGNDIADSLSEFEMLLVYVAWKLRGQVDRWPRSCSHLVMFWMREISNACEVILRVEVVRLDTMGRSKE